jgi:hypothetical protein
MTEEKNKGGRPTKQIDWEVFEKLCSMQCTQVEMASVLKVHIDTLRDRAEEHYEDSYSNVYAKYSCPGKASLRSTQFRLAQKNATMAIWLGKNWLGQRDNDDKNNQNVTLTDIINFVSELKKSPEPGLPA